MQTFHQWQQSPEQGVIPGQATDCLQHADVVQENLIEALGALTLCIHLMENTGDSRKFTELFSVTADALNSVNQAIEHIEDVSDE